MISKLPIVGKSTPNKLAGTGGNLVALVGLKHYEKNTESLAQIAV